MGVHQLLGALEAVFALGDGDGLGLGFAIFQGGERRREVCCWSLGMSLSEGGSGGEDGQSGGGGDKAAASQHRFLLL
jgi:hypothetical protein